MSLLFAFDMDNVLYDYRWRERMDSLAELTGTPVSRLRELWWLHPEGEAFAEAGGYPDGTAYLAAFAARTGHEVSPDAWLTARGAAMTPLPQSIEAARRASELGRVTLLTNNGPLVGAALPRIAPLLVPIFSDEHLRATSFYGARKPDPTVFERLLEEYDTLASDAFFADDLIENVEAAASVGITVHHFTGDAARMRADIEAFAAARA